MFYMHNNPGGFRQVGISCKFLLTAVTRVDGGGLGHELGLILGSSNGAYFDA